MYSVEGAILGFLLGYLKGYYTRLPLRYAYGHYNRVPSMGLVEALGFWAGGKLKAIRPLAAVSAVAFSGLGFRVLYSPDRGQCNPGPEALGRLVNRTLENTGILGLLLSLSITPHHSISKFDKRIMWRRENPNKHSTPTLLATAPGISWRACRRVASVTGIANGSVFYCRILYHTTCIELL